MRRDDLLRRATRAMRQEVQGKNSGSGFTRARIMRTLQKRRKRTGLAWIVVPALGFALGSTAWASATGRLPVLVQRVAVLLELPQHAPRVEAVAGTKASAPQRRSVPMPDLDDEALPDDEDEALPAVEDEALPDVEKLVKDVNPSGSDVAGPSEQRRPPVVPVSPRPPAVVAAPAEVETPAEQALGPDPELRAFRAAHGAHFSGTSSRAAIAAYQRYLEQYPAGRFVPEAHYNIALNLVRLGDFRAARTALKPFAEGLYGDYRQREAERLLQAMTVRTGERIRSTGGD